MKEQLKILIVSQPFFPSVGGVQTVTRLLAEALVQAGHRVTVVTSEPGKEADLCGVQLSRVPTAVELLKQYKMADVVVLQGLTTRLGWPLLLRRRTAFAVHHIQPSCCEGRLRKALEGKLAKRLRHAAVSRALAQELPWRIEAILPNPYEDKIFRADETAVRSWDVIFVGRLIPEKGVPVLIEALALLRQRARCMTATIVGDGPEKCGLEDMVKSRKLQQSVLFAGEVTGRALAQLLNRHLLMVVPSVHHEPFGVVALEGIACGCVVIGSDAGGLPEAIRPCGTTFPPGDARALAQRIEEVLGSANMMARFRACAERHLAGHRPSVVATKYLELLRAEHLQVKHLRSKNCD